MAVCDQRSLGSDSAPINTERTCPSSDRLKENLGTLLRKLWNARCVRVTLSIQNLNPRELLHLRHQPALHSRLQIDKNGNPTQEYTFLSLSLDFFYLTSPSLFPLSLVKLSMIIKRQFGLASSLLCCVCCVEEGRLPQRPNLTERESLIKTTHPHLPSRTDEGGQIIEWTILLLFALWIFKKARKTQNYEYKNCVMIHQSCKPLGIAVGQEGFPALSGMCNTHYTLHTQAESSSPNIFLGRQAGLFEIR